MTDNNTTFQVFTDFDGTVALNDVGDKFFERFIGPDWIIANENYKAGKITSKLYLIEQCQLARVTRQQMTEFSDEQQIDPHFQYLVDFCRNKNYPITVLSDGLDFYIQRILDNFGLSDLAIRSNHVKFLDGNRIAVEFPYFEYGCQACANCKGYHIRNIPGNGTRTVQIGDGLSDRCGAVEADFIFAKNDLVEFCKKHDLSYFEYSNFNDILLKLKTLDTE
ncbi:MAG: MtnX-like HAD-IB family phosphatase [Candidatus Zhuqueibacterota bacterium]